METTQLVEAVKFWYTVLLTVTDMLFSNILTFMITNTLYIFIAINKSNKSDPFEVSFVVCIFTLSE